mmetsp:Transcript_17194/g.30946  ORF Transcript_17194/g.30946 Transcript_17194/m.30946 type:complete len:97 (+) Transcript_17194:1396-1686(+)
MGIANAVVTFRASTDSLIIKADDVVPPNWINFEKAAVPNKAPKLETSMLATTIKKFSFNNVFRLYMLTANETTLGPNRNKRTSPAPAVPSAMVPVL